MAVGKDTYTSPGTGGIFPTSPQNYLDEFIGRQRATSPILLSSNLHVSYSIELKESHQPLQSFSDGNLDSLSLSKPSLGSSKLSSGMPRLCHSASTFSKNPAKSSSYS